MQHTSPPFVPAKITTWRDVLPVHPAADLFPMMTRDEPILIDGRNRLDAMQLVGLDIDLNNVAMKAYCRKCQKDGSDFDPYAYVISANIHRRHLTADQKRDLTVNQRAIVGAKLANIAGAGRPSKTDSQPAETVEENNRAAPPHLSRKQAATKVKVSLTSVRYGRKILAAGNAELLAAVRPPMSRSAKRPQPPKSQAQKALAQFKVAVDIWFSKMDDDAKREAAEYVIAKGAAFGEVRA